ncbi:CHASE2 domain-containing protein [Sandaracinobacter sp. RS1-74]|uniref:CHASE2 domain-containing protein n=1 Tax=Sandaracinobacteroides sayramensis TaxID=2913411 RepID=UPI001EDC6391|nr:CHASE2 domain-containing protein [Sandaracinobacteroides sayramensis]MCG2842790.1 CHASE2 domain-containing protein [Sandaracinobacteroides sayramensis]
MNMPSHPLPALPEGKGGIAAPGAQAPGAQAPGSQAPGSQAPGSQAPGSQASTGPAAGEPEEFNFRSRRMLIEWWAVLVTATLAIVSISYLWPPVRADNLFYDLVLRLNPPPPSQRVLIVAIDNRSLNEIGRWPWSRDVHARLIERLTEAKPAAIGYDVLFPEAQAPEADAHLAQAIARNGRVILPAIIEIPGPDGAPSLRVPPVEPLATAAAATGHVVTRPDRDGVVRGIDRLSDPEGRRNLHMSEAVVAYAQGDWDLLDAPRPAPDAPVYAPARDLIPFAGPAGSYAQLSFADVMAGRVPPDLIAGRIVLVGATGSGLGDRFSTPMSGTLETMAGVELHANYVDSLLTDRMIRPVPPLVWQLFSLLPVWMLMLSLLFLGPRVNLWLGVGIGIGVFAITVVSLAFFHIWLPPAMALIAVGLIYPLWGWRRLDIASRYMVAELKELRAEETVLPRHRGEVSGDPVERQIILMHEAIRDVRDLRRFIAQSLDSLPDAAVVTDLDGYVLIANDAADALFERRLAGPTLGRPLEDLFRSLDPDPRLPDPRAAELMANLSTMAIPADGKPLDAGYETRLADGKSLEIRLAHFTDAERRPLGWIARFADITALRASERQREDALRLLTHDMRAPQASILAVLEAEGRKVPPELARRLERYAHQTLSLADDFVHLARAESGRFLVETFNLSEAVLDAVDDLWPLADAKRIRIVSDVPEDEALVTGDRALITRSITNLLGNAIKYSDERTKVQARVRLEEPEVVCEIVDEGRGIAAEDLPKLFEAFSRLAPPEGAAPAASAPGAGLGLAFVKAVIERHGGATSVTSEEGKGSVFGFRLPRTRLD